MHRHQQLFAKMVGSSKDSAVRALACMGQAAWQQADKRFSSGYTGVTVALLHVTW
jgi:hypothetical protein